MEDTDWTKEKRKNYINKEIQIKTVNESLLSMVLSLCGSESSESLDQTLHQNLELLCGFL